MTKKTKKILLGILIAIVVIFSLLEIANYIVSKKLPEVLNKEAKNYKIDFEELDIDWFEQSIEIESIDIIPLNKKKSRVQTHVKEIEIEEVNFFKLIFKDRLLVDLLEVDSAVTEVILLGKAKKKKEQPLKKFLREVLHRIEVKNINLKRSSIVFYEGLDSIPKIKVDKYNFAFNNIVLDTTSVKKILPFRMKSMSGNVTGGNVRIDSLYELSFSHLNITDDDIRIDSLEYSTPIEKESFQSMMPIEKDWILLAVPKLVINRYTWEADTEQFYFNTDKILLERLKIEAYRDKNKPFGPKTEKPMPNRLIRNLPIAINVDSIEVVQGDIRYQEKADGENVRGVVDFDDVYATLYNVTNNPEVLKNNPIMMLDAQSKFNQCGEIKTHWEFNIPDKQDHFSVSGSLGKMDFSCLNQTFHPLLDVKVNGQIHELSFDYNGTRTTSTGEVHFIYEDLKLNFENENAKLGDWLKTTFGNLAINNKNLKSEKRYQKGDFTFERTMHKSFFNYLWKSIQSGAIKIVRPFKGKKVEE